MGDEENLNLEDVGAGSDDVEVEGKKAGFLPSFIIKILKWVALGLGFIILGVTTTVITFNLVNKGRKTSDMTQRSPEYTAKTDPLEYDDTIESIRGVTADETPAIFNIQVSIGYESGNTEIAFELNARRREIQNIVFIYISTKKRDQLRPEYYKQLLEDLKQQINRVMKSGSIKTVIFRDFVVTQ